MLDSILHIGATDSVPYYLERGAVSVDTFSTRFTPFDYIPTGDNSLFFSVDTLSIDAAGVRMVDGISGAPLLFTPTIQNVLFLIFACSFLLLSVFTKRDGISFLSNLKGLALFSSKSRSAFKEQITISSIWINIYMVFQTVTLSSVVGTVILWQNSDTIALPTDKIFLLFCYLFAGILAFVLIKYIIYVLVDYTFPDWRLQEWISQYFTVVGLLGIIMYIPALFVTFTPEYFSVTIWLLLGTLAVIMFFYYRNLLIIFVKNNIGLLNYFLYLCAIEIVPLFLVYKGGIILQI